MRHLLLLSIFALSYAADLEQITTTDGRRFIGYYDGEAQTMTIEGPPKAVVRIPREQVVERSAYIRPEEKDPAKRDAAALVKMEAERIAAIGEAARLFKYAESHSGQEAAAARIQAADRLSLADELSKKMAPIQERAAAAKAAAPDPKASAAPAQPPMSATAAKLEEAYRLEEKAADIKFQALRAHLQAMDLTSMKVPELAADPRKSDELARRAIMAENERRVLLASLLKESDSATRLQHKSGWCHRAMMVLDELPKESKAALAEAEAIAAADRLRVEEIERKRAERKGAKAR